jgi:ectoine hydroxylase-related dioxygenase (phytanoyl-CoA dioxygenase family)
MRREEQVAYFRRHGYLAVEDVFSHDEIERLRASLEALEHRARGRPERTDRLKLTLFGSGVEDRTVQQIAEPHEIDGTWMDLAADPRILDLVEALIGPNILLYYSMLMMKPARSGAPAPWHQDLAFFVHDRARLVACQVYLDDSTTENGCIHVVPGSHRFGLLNHFDGDRFTEIVQGDTSAFDAAAVAVPVRAGGMILWHCLTLHSSQPNDSDRNRRAAVFEYKDPDARLLTGSFAPGEVRTVGKMVRGVDPGGELLSAF